MGPIGAYERRPREGTYLSSVIIAELDSRVGEYIRHSSFTEPLFLFLGTANVTNAILISA